jgi:ribosomal protein L16 Arg81 hydroxylase
MAEIFSDLIAPIDKREFIEKYLAKQGVHIKPKKAGRFNNLFDWDYLNRILATSHLTINHLSLGTNGLEEKLAPGNFTASKILKSCSFSGSTLHIRGIHEYDDELFKHFSRLAIELKSMVKVNLYASAPEHQAIYLHKDDHDVFILQIDGKKNWKVYSEGKLNPELRDPPEPPYIDCDLEPGDVLYIPVGHWHIALAATPSLHLTVAPYWTKGINYTNWLQAKIESEINNFFPLLPLEKNSSNFLGEWQNELSGFNNKIFEKLDDNNLQAEFYRNARVKIHNRTNFNFPYHYLENTIKELDSENFYRPETCKAVVSDDGNVFLINYQFIFNRDLVPVLKFIFNNNFFSENDLLQLNPAINSEQIIEVLNLFIKEGIIRFSDKNIRNERK